MKKKGTSWQEMRISSAQFDSLFNKVRKILNGVRSDTLFSNYTSASNAQHTSYQCRHDDEARC